MRADQAEDVFDNTNNGGGSTMSAPIPGTAVPVIATKRGASGGVINQGPYIVTAKANKQANGPGLQVSTGIVRVHAFSTNTKPVKVANGRDSIGAEFSPDTERLFPCTSMSQIFMTPIVDDEGIEISVKENQS